MILLLNLHFKLVLVCLDEGSNTVIRCQGHDTCDSKAETSLPCCQICRVWSHWHLVCVARPQHHVLWSSVRTLVSVHL